MTKETLYTASGEIDKRSANGNNGTARGKDRKQRKPRAHVLALKPEVLGGIRARTEQVFDFFGGPKAISDLLGVKYATVWRWKVVGRISPDGCHAFHRFYVKTGRVGFTAHWLRPDLRFDGNGKPIDRSPYCTNKRYIEKRNLIASTK